MAYYYETQKPQLLTDEGQRKFLKTRDKVNALLGASGAFMMQHSFETGDAWDMMAYIDRMVELGEIVEVKNPISNAGQHRIFIKPL